MVRLLKFESGIRPPVQRQSEGVSGVGKVLTGACAFAVTLGNGVPAVIKLGVGGCPVSRRKRVGGNLLCGRRKGDMRASVSHCGRSAGGFSGLYVASGGHTTGERVVGVYGRRQPRQCGCVVRVGVGGESGRFGARGSGVGKGGGGFDGVRFENGFRFS